MFKEYKTISVFIPSAASCAPLFCLCMCMLSPSAKLNIILVLVMFINFLIILYRRGVWRNIWRGSMLQSIGCLTSLVEHLYVCLKFAIWCPITYWLLLRLCSVIFCFFSCWVGTQAFIWSPQSKGVLAFDPYPQEQVEVCSELPWSYFNLDAASSYGWWQGQDWQDISIWIHG